MTVLVAYARALGSTRERAQHVASRMAVALGEVECRSVEEAGAVSRYEAVVVGSAYPPFRAEEGRLERGSFESLMKSAYGVSRTNGTVSEAAMKTGVAVSFTAARVGYRLRVVSVQPSRAGDDALTMKLCK